MKQYVSPRAVVLDLSKALCELLVLSDKAIGGAEPWCLKRFGRV